MSFENLTVSFFYKHFSWRLYFFQDQDEELLSAELVKYDELLNIKKVWGKGIGKGSEQPTFSWPSGNSEQFIQPVTMERSRP